MSALPDSYTSADAYNETPAGLGRPRSVADTGLKETLLVELVGKRLYTVGEQTLRQLSSAVALSGPVLEELLGALRQEAMIELRSSPAAGMRYLLTDKGRAWAAEAMLRSGYVGPAPVPLAVYSQVVEAQSVHGVHVSHATMRAAYTDAVVSDAMLDQLGPAIHSGRPLFLYGPPGSGKTFLAQRLPRLLGDTVLVPHAISVDEQIIQFFDPVVHRPVEEPERGHEVLIDNGHDPRFIRCQRPSVITGGELTLDMLEVSYDSNSKVYTAPLHLKANNGLYMIDDLGRQRMAPSELLNRWIIPIEERRDFLTLGAGKHFPVPFDVILVFSTNLDPLSLADEAFLRRLGYKIRFRHLEASDYTAILQQVCTERGVCFGPDALDYLLTELHGRQRVPMLPCHPRDLVGLVLDYCRYHDEPAELTPEHLTRAWRSYFVELQDRQGSTVQTWAERSQRDLPPHAPSMRAR
jgi:hypothetical protein